MTDFNKEALAIWESLKPAVDKEIERKTAGTVQRRKVVVSTAPSSLTGLVGVQEPFGVEFFVPYRTEVAAATVGDPVWIEFAYGANNAVAIGMASLVDTGTQTFDDVTITGTLDITPRRCYATLSSAGWYRVMTFNAPNENEAKGRYVFSIDVTLMDLRMDVHKITLLSTNELLSFVNETSKTSSTQYFTKIRYNYDSSHGYIDVYYAGNNARTMSCFLDVKCEVNRRSLWVSQPFASVADSPAGETVVTTYSFAANTEWSAVITKTGTTSATLPSDWKELHVNARFGGNTTYGFVFNVRHDSMYGTYDRFIGGSYGGASDYHVMNIEVGQNYVKLVSWNYRGTDYTSSSVIEVQYKC